jgi:hypothetical protein
MVTSDGLRGSTVRRLRYRLFELTTLAATLVVQPPCGLDYGTTEDRRRIQRAMLNGSAAQVRLAVNAAKATRGAALGCAQRALPVRGPIDTTPPRFEDILAVWDQVVQPELDAYRDSCPGLGRQWPAIALAAYQARRAGVEMSNEPLIRTARMALDQQYTKAVAPEPLVTEPGVFGVYLAEGDGDPCAIPGVPGEGSALFCARFPDLCPRYDSGRWAGARFAVADHLRTGDDLEGDPGGLGFDQGWMTAMLIEASLALDDPDLTHRCRQAALLNARWALGQPPVTNHNYTAKLVWLLARTYALTGRHDLRHGLVDRLERNLAPGVLMDADGDGLVDGVSPPVPFADLTDVASTPGRMWDGHNALPWYHSVNAWAMVEAYAALRDRGHGDLAERYRPLAVAMVNNLAREILTLGPPAPRETGWTDTPFAILLAQWAIARAENEPHPLWDDAAAALWNSGACEVRGTRMHAVGWYLLLASDVPYESLEERASRGRPPRMSPGRAG